MEGLARQVQQDRGVLTDAVEQNGRSKAAAVSRKTQMASASRASSTREVSWSIDMWLISSFVVVRRRQGAAYADVRRPTAACMILGR